MQFLLAIDFPTKSSPTKLWYVTYLLILFSGLRAPSSEIRWEDRNMFLPGCCHPKSSCICVLFMLLIAAAGPLFEHPMSLSGNKIFWCMHAQWIRMLAATAFKLHEPGGPYMLESKIFVLKIAERKGGGDFPIRKIKRILTS